ncbi:type II secretion system F family protein [Ferrimonas sediminicola]|uniref:Type II secretion system F family protein n=1 Tax=Ferrimonas sediminicola TaxID=2569538 RepID=A0A4U1BE72_9GAMM|nr:type II secretion system F family protein [Ferrimonas sediminicola]TKB48927.1 type II secretion system F family protein [Ferrimonas sediminicola]
MTYIPPYIFYLVALVSALLLAWVGARIWDRFATRWSVNQLLGGNQGESPRGKLLDKVVSPFSFNQKEVEKKLTSAGIYQPWLAQSYYFLKFIPFVVVLAVGIFMVLRGYLDSTQFILTVSLSAVAFLVVPDIYLEMRAKRLVRQISGRLPFLLDLMNVCVHTGMTVEASLAHLAGELVMVDRHLARVVRVTVERSKVVGIEKAIHEFYELVPTSESQSFVMTIVQSLQYGSSVGPVLSSLASDIREINMMNLEEKIGKLGAKMSIPLILFIMVPIVVLIAAPGIMRMLS